MPAPMESATQRPQQKASEAYAQLAELISSSSRHSEGAFPNLRALHKQRQRNATAGPSQQPGARATSESPSVAAARIALAEARARRLAAEAEKAKAEETLKRSKPSDVRNTSPLFKKESKTAIPTSRSLALALRPLKARKVSSLFNNVILGLNNVSARTWEAPTQELIVLDQARKALGNQKFNDDKRTRALATLLNEVRARGGDDADTIKVLRDLMDRKITAEEAEKKMKAIEDGKKPDGKGLSFAEQEELARLEIKAQQLILQKLELERREEHRKEVEEIQKRIREKGLAIQITRPVVDPYAAYYGRGQLHGQPGFEEYGEGDMFDDAASNVFGVDDEMFSSGQDLALRRGQTLDGRSRGLNEQIRAADPYLDDEGMLLDHGGLDAGRSAGVRAIAGHPLQQRGSRQGYETLGNTGLPKFNNVPSSRNLKRAQSSGAAVNFRISPNDPRLDPRSQYYKAEYVRAFREQQLRDAQQMKLVQQAEMEKARKLEMEKKALANERAQALAGAQVYQERKLLEEAQAKATREAKQRARDAEILHKRRQLQEVRSMEEILAAEQQLNYLEDLLKSNPRAAIPGLDLRELKDEPNLLPRVLQLVEENIRRPQAVQHSARLLQETLGKARADSERRDRLHRQEQELNRLETLLTQHPYASIKGLDMSRVNSDPEILQQALRQVEESIRRGENPIEIPIPGIVEPLLNEARTRQQFTEQERNLMERFLQAKPEVQIQHLRSFPNHASQSRFLATVIQEADLVRGQQLINLFQPYGFDIHLPPDAPGRSSHFDHTPAPSVPTIVVDRILSPPPTQDTEPSYPFPNMSNDVAREPSESAWKGKGKGMQDSSANPGPTYTVIDHHSSRTSRLPSPPSATPGRTSVAHPSAAATMAAAADISKRQEDLAAEEAELERERQDIIEAEEALLRSESEGAMVEAQKCANEETYALLKMQQEEREQAATEIEEAAQIQAREMAEAEAAFKQVWSPLPTPRDDFVAASPVVASLPRSPNDSTTQAGDTWGLPARDPFEEAADVETAQAANEGSPQARDAWGSPQSKRSVVSLSPKSASLNASGSKLASPKALSRNPSRAPSTTSLASPARFSNKTASPAAAWSPLQTPVDTPKLASVNASKAASTVAALSPRAPSMHSEAKASPLPVLSNTPLAASPMPSMHSTSKAATPKVGSPLELQEGSPLLIKSPAPVASPARSATPKAASARVTPKATVSKLATPAATPKMATPAATPKVASPVSTSKVATPAATPKIPTPLSTPKIATPAADMDAWGNSSVKTASPAKSTTSVAREAWGSPALSTRASVKTASPARSRASEPKDAWGSPAPSVKNGSPMKSTVAPVEDAWGLPIVASPAAKSPSVASNRGQDAWGAASPATIATPLPVTVATPKVASPAKSNISKASSAKAASLQSKLVSPAFGLAAAGKDGQSAQNSPAPVEGPRTAIKGSDPVVVSMAEPITPYGADDSKPNAAGADQAEGLYPGEEYEDYSDEEEDGEHLQLAPFDPEQFPIYMKGEPLDPGLCLHPGAAPHPFQERYPKIRPDVTEDHVLDHFAALAHNHGYHALYQCEMADLGDSFIIQGYMVHLGTDVAPPSAVGGPIEIADKNAGKATMVSDASTPGL